MVSPNLGNASAPTKPCRVRAQRARGAPPASDSRGCAVFSARALPATTRCALPSDERPLLAGKRDVCADDDLV